MNKKKKQNKMFIVNKLTMGISIFLCVLMGVLFFVCLKAESLTSINVAVAGENAAKFLENYAWIDILKNIALVIFTILLSSILMALFIEIRARNNLYDSALEEIFTSESFLRERKDSENEETLEKLESLLFFKDSEQGKKMYASVKEKCKEFFNSRIYYDHIKVTVKCNINERENTIEKKIEIKRAYRAFDKDEYYPPETFCLETSSCKSGSCYENNKITLKEGDRNGAEKRLKKGEDYTFKQYICEDEVMGVNGYTDRNDCILKRGITIKKDEPTVLTLSYASSVALNDNAYIFRTNLPCKSFNLTYTLEGKAKEQYVLLASAFGFNDKGEESMEKDCEYVANISLKDWTFKGDGVVIVMQKKDL